MNSAPTLTTSTDNDTDAVITIPTTGRDTAWLTINDTYAIAVTITPDGLTVTAHPDGHEDTTTLAALTVHVDEATAPRCDECGVRDEDTANWCGNCGSCATHCQQYDGCPEPA